MQTHLGMCGGLLGGSDRVQHEGCIGVVGPQLSHHISAKMAKAAVVIHQTLEALQQTGLPQL